MPPQLEDTLRSMEGARRYNDWLFSRCAPHIGRRVLDVGAGIGTFTALVAESAPVLALEPDPAFARHLTTRFAGDSNVTVFQGSASDLSPGAIGKAFDTIVCLNVLEHIPNDTAALEHFRRLLSPGGWFLLLVPAHPFLFGSLDRAMGHERRYRKDGLRELLERAGFEIETLRPVNPLGAVGWFVSARILKRTQIPDVPLRVYDGLVPLVRTLDRIRLPVGLSLWAVARRPAASEGEAEQRLQEPGGEGVDPGS
jgi:SAM-dependent methyltransferase